MFVCPENIRSITMGNELTNEEVNQFIEQGFVKIENAFPSELAVACREILWRDTGCDPNDAGSWTHPVIRLGNYSEEPFRQAANTEKLHIAFDQLVGKDRWLPRGGLGTFPIRFPNPSDPGDAGWHADAGFYGDDGSMRLNVQSKGRALLMLFLFSDVGLNDAPTRILSGSHLDVPLLLTPAGDDGLTFLELAQRLQQKTLEREVAFATGCAGTVFLCHPFLIHGAQKHQGQSPRFLAQPPLQPASSDSIMLNRDNGDYSPVEIAIRLGLSID